MGERFPETKAPVEQLLSEGNVYTHLACQLVAIRRVHDRLEEENGKLVQRGHWAMAPSGALFHMSLVLNGPQHSEDPPLADLRKLCQPPQVLVYGGIVGADIWQLYVGHVDRHMGRYTAYVASQPNMNGLDPVGVMREADSSARLGLTAADSLQRGTHFLLNLAYPPEHALPMAGTELLEPLADVCSRIGVAVPPTV
jgi:hypothetical protein